MVHGKILNEFFYMCHIRIQLLEQHVSFYLKESSFGNSIGFENL